MKLFVSLALVASASAFEFGVNAPYVSLLGSSCANEKEDDCNQDGVSWTCEMDTLMVQAPTVGSTSMNCDRYIYPS
jgi:hypothetical protein